MRHRVAVVGSTGRVGRALCSHLVDRYDVVPIARRPGEAMEDLADRAASEADVVVNAAGVAHIARPTPDDSPRLEVANVELPAALTAAALQHGIPMIHISSAKAAEPNANSAYARSKRRGDQRLEQEFRDQFDATGLALVIVRPLALLFPPLDAGKVNRLRFLRRWPRALTPPVRLPVLAPATFLALIDSCILSLVSGAGHPGVSVRDFGRRDYGTLRDVRAAFVKQQEDGGSR